ncbi:MAG: UvrB/UvrC motif-containing protein [Oscillospiraceae bacterium]|jgi:protein arginine kinase activator|nr:UvrB/UvrC motif-containing protein [Oscillospiraceae bacterium]
MKCENCGKNEINFHFTSNVNGVVTERHLCSECAAKLGYGGVTSMAPGGLLGGMLGGVFNDFFGHGRGMAPMGGFEMAIPAFAAPIFALTAPQTVWQPDMDTPSETGPDVRLDDDLKKRLEINKLRAQMQKAAQDEDFETAAHIRDCIRKIEGETAPDEGGKTQ